ncbi:MAG: shikimate dehydrogenase [Caulobacteraceae bacterium]
MTGLTASTRLAGVIGAPARHSLSPLMHNAWLEAAGIDAAYAAFECEPDDFETAVAGLAASGVLGLNVTLPFKERALALAVSADALSTRAGAANLLLFRGGSIEACNTDGPGMLSALTQTGFGGGSVCVLGAGGAARGAVAALAGVGVTDLRIVNRTVARADAMRAVEPSIHVFGWDEAAQALDGAAALVNATSLGLHGQPGVDLDLSLLPPSAVVVDAVYGPAETALVQNAKSLGLRAADGLAMLIAQAIPSFEALFGQPPPGSVDVLALCEQALGRQA